MKKEYWLRIGHQVTGPFTGSQIRQLAAQGKIRGEHKISLDRKQWFPAAKVKSIAIASDPAEASNSSSTKECPFCGEEILSKARKCKHCGEFLDQALSATPSRLRADPGPEKTLWEARPSLLGYLLALLVGVALIPALGVGIIVIVVTILDQRNRIYTITNHKVMVKWGIISRNTKEVAVRDVRNINMSQGILGRIFGIGTVAVASAGTGTVDVTFFGTNNPMTVRDLVRQIKEDQGSPYGE